MTFSLSPAEPNATTAKKSDNAKTKDESDAAASGTKSGDWFDSVWYYSHSTARLIVSSFNGVRVPWLVE